MVNSDKNRVVVLERYNTDNYNRLNYYTICSLSIPEIPSIRIPMKIDTGSMITVFSLSYPPLDSLSQSILSKFQFEPKCLETAEGVRLDAYLYKAEYFEIAPGIRIENFIVYFSDKIQRSLLGMDILSLFEFAYKFENNHRYGTFRLLDPESAIQRYYAWSSDKRLINLESYDIEKLTKAAPTAWKQGALTVDEVAIRMIETFPDIAEKYKVR